MKGALSLASEIGSFAIVDIPRVCVRFSVKMEPHKLNENVTVQVVWEGEAPAEP